MRAETESERCSQSHLHPHLCPGELKGYPGNTPAFDIKGLLCLFKSQPFKASFQEAIHQELLRENKKINNNSYKVANCGSYWSERSSQVLTAAQRVRQALRWGAGEGAARAHTHTHTHTHTVKKLQD